MIQEATVLPSILINKSEIIATYQPTLELIPEFEMNPMYADPNKHSFGK